MKKLKWWHAPTHHKPRDVESVRSARTSPPQKERIIRRRHTRSHLKVWEYFHKKPHIQLPAHSFYENNEWFLYFSLILCRFYPWQREGEPVVVASFRLRLFAIREARASEANHFIPAEALFPRPRRMQFPIDFHSPAPHFTLLTLAAPNLYMPLMFHIAASADSTVNKTFFITHTRKLGLKLPEQSGFKELLSNLRENRFATMMM